MKRIGAVLALAVAATLVTVAPAQAAPVSPVKALKKQLSPGHGVRISETSHTSSGKSKVTAVTTGVLEFGKSRVIASELKTRYKGAAGAGFSPARTISVGGYTYARGGVFSESLPEGKKWTRYTGAPITSSNQLIDIFDAKVLKVVLAKAKVVKGDYQGVITAKELLKLHGQKVSGEVGRIKIKYVLDTDAKGLVSRVTTGYTVNFGVLGSVKSLIETRFTGWGARIKVKAPPKSQWIDVKDLGEDTEVPKDIPDNSINSLGRH